MTSRTSLGKIQVEALYTVEAWGAHNPINRLILNYKKPLERQGYSDWSYKEQAILED